MKLFKGSLLVLFSTSRCDRKSVLRDNPSAENPKLAFLGGRMTFKW